MYFYNGLHGLYGFLVARGDDGRMQNNPNGRSRRGSKNPYNPCNPLWKSHSSLFLFFLWVKPVLEGQHDVAVEIVFAAFCVGGGGDAVGVAFDLAQKVFAF